MDAQLLETFLAESEELLSDLEEGLVALEECSDDPDTVNRVFRSAHTLKGNAGMLGLTAFVGAAHVLENLLDNVRARTLTADKALVNALLSGLDVLKSMTADASAGKEVRATPAHEEILASLRGFLGGPKPTTPKGPASPPVTANAPGATTVDTSAAGVPATNLGAAGVPATNLGAAGVPTTNLGAAGSAAVKAPPSAAAKNSNAPGRSKTAAKTFELELTFRPDVFDFGEDPFSALEDLAELGTIVSIEPELSNLPDMLALEPSRFFLGWKIRLESEATEDEIRANFLFVGEPDKIVVRDVTVVDAAIDLEAADMKLGELLVQAAVVTEADVAKALAKQRKIGEILVEEGKIQPETLGAIVAKQEAARKAAYGASIRVDLDKLDRLMNLVGELVIAVSQVRQRSLSNDGRNATEGLEQISRDLQDQVMSLRMVPIRATFERFKRPIRDLAEELGKQVTLEMSGVETELDKNVIEKLGDPLKHMVRNSIAHGIELPAERVHAGKSEVGRVHLRAAQREGHIEIEIEDDGRGIDPERIVAKARERGLLHSSKVPNEQEIYALMFEPGFSTAAVVDEISGRGVGLDVVKKNVEALHGRIEVRSTLGKGTTFVIRLPLTLAIIDGMNVKVGEETVTIPLLSVVELLEPKADVIHTIEGRCELVDVRGELLPMVRLADVFEVQRRESVEAKVVVVESEHRKFGILVDSVLGMAQAVIKPLDRSFRLFGALERTWSRPSGISGATILGDGRVGIVLDVHGVEQMAFGTMN